MDPVQNGQLMAFDPDYNNHGAPIFFRLQNESSLLEDRTENKTPMPRLIGLDSRTEGIDLRAHGE